MKVLQVVKHYYPYRGGVESYTREVVLGLKDIPGLSLEVLTANEVRETVEEKVDGVPVTRVASFGEKFSVPLCPTFPYWLKQKPAEIKHFQMPFPLAEFAELLGPKKKQDRRFLAQRHCQTGRPAQALRTVFCGVFSTGPIRSWSRPRTILPLRSFCRTTKISAPLSLTGSIPSASTRSNQAIPRSWHCAGKRNSWSFLSAAWSITKGSST